MLCHECQFYSPGGICRNPKVHKREVGYFQEACSHFAPPQNESEPNETPTPMEPKQETPTTKVCRRCGRELPLESFAKNKSRQDGLQESCRECMASYNREYRTRHHGKKFGFAGDPDPKTKEKPMDEVKMAAAPAKNELGKKFEENIDRSILEAAKAPSELEKRILDAELPAPVIINPSVSEIPDIDLVKELRRRGYKVKCEKTVKL